ncbi:hypothetical protein, partial [Actinacidiphila oryziradicis]|uniref:hypothetical protein n=1 Tax=Actinacidiphila oryziradicis TaxID=2571141 RepID=UPI0023F3E6FB
ISREQCLAAMLRWAVRPPMRRAQRVTLALIRTWTATPPTPTPVCDQNLAAAGTISLPINASRSVSQTRGTRP